MAGPRRPSTLMALASALAACVPIAFAACGGDDSGGGGNGEPRVASGSSATFSENATYQTGGTVTLLYDEADPLAEFQLEFRDFGFMEALDTADTRIYVGEGSTYLPHAALSGNLVGSVDEIPESAPGLPPIENRTDGTQVVTVPASAGFTVADFDSVILYCHPFDIVVSVAAF